MNAWETKNVAQNELGTVKLFRFDPEVDNKPRYDEFKAPYQGHTVLDVLRYIYENLDSSFAFRWACKRCFCRCCVVSVNGRAVLSCTAPAQKEMKIEPHPKFTLIKDLIVDLDRPKKSR